MEEGPCYVNLEVYTEHHGMFKYSHVTDYHIDNDYLTITLSDGSKRVFVPESWYHIAATPEE